MTWINNIWDLLGVVFVASVSFMILMISLAVFISAVRRSKHRDDDLYTMRDREIYSSLEQGHNNERESND